VDVDKAPRELAAARWRSSADAANGRSGTLELVNADITELAIRKRFDLVILALNTLLLMPGRAAQRRVLQVMAAHLTRDGRAVVDVWLPSVDDLTLYDGRLMLDWIKLDPTTGQNVAKTTSARHEPEANTAEITTIYDAWHDGAPPKRLHRRDAVNFVTAPQVLEMLESAGLEPEMIAGDYDMSDPGPESERVIVVCRANRAIGSGPSGSGRKGRPQRI
jgi:hypothetical protein